MTVEEFTNTMREKLEKHEHDRNWRDEDPLLLLVKLIGETHELLEELQLVPRDPARVGRECADVANFAYMIADVVTCES